MKSRFTLNNYFFQFILFIILNTSFSIIAYLALSNLNFRPPNPGEPLGASDSFIIYNNLIKGLVVVMLLHFYRASRANEIAQPILRYGLLALFIYIGNGILQTIMMAVVDDRVDYSMIIWSATVPMVFRINMIAAGLVVYGWSALQEKREVNDLSRKLELSTLQELKTKAELEALQAKVNPHFLYNALNSVYTLIDEQPVKAKEIIMLMSKFFRLSVNSSSDSYWSLGEELELVSTYLEIERVRFGDKLKVDVQCPDSLMGAEIPRFMLQPLVENAVKHGTSQLSGQGHIAIVIENKHDHLGIQVRDNGPAFKAQLNQGYGLRSVTDKINLLGGAGSSIELISTDKVVPSIAGPWKYVGIKLMKRESAHY